MSDVRHLHEIDAEISYRQELLRKAMQRNPRRPSMLRRSARRHGEAPGTAGAAVADAVADGVR